MQLKAKIAIVSPSCPPLSNGGVASAHYNLQLTLQKQGFEVVLFTFGDSADHHPKDPQNIIRYCSPKFITRSISILLKLFWFATERGKSCSQLLDHLKHAFGAWRIRKRVSDFAPDILIVPDRSCPGFWLKKTHDCKVIHISHHNPSRFTSPLFFERPPSHKDIKAALWLEQKAMQYVDIVICPSRYMKKCFQSTFQFQGEICIIPNLIDPQCANIPPLDLHSQLGIATNTPIIYIPSAGFPLKGSRYVFEILRRIHATMPHVAFFLSGDIPPPLQEELYSLSFKSSIHAPGALPYQENLASIAATSLCISPTLTENYSMAICEASAMGVPTIAFNSGGNEDIITNNETGYLIPYLDVDALIEKSVYLLQSPQLLKIFSENARLKMQEDMSSASERMKNVLMQCISNTHKMNT